VSEVGRWRETDHREDHRIEVVTDHRIETVMDHRIETVMDHRIETVTDHMIEVVVEIGRRSAMNARAGSHLNSK